MKGLLAIFLAVQNLCIATILSFKDLIKSLSPANLKQNYAVLRHKLKDLKLTNWELAQYHFAAGNTNDAIMRFKILLRFKYRTNEINYFLGRLYVEKRKYIKAKKFLEDYLSSGDQNYHEEASYCMSIIARENVKEIPWKILLHKRDKIAVGIARAKTDETMLSLYANITIALKSEVQQASRILEIGCYVALLGSALREKFEFQYLAGSEFGEKSFDLCREIKLQAKPVYDKLLHVKNSLDFVPQNEKYSIVVVADLLKYLSNVEALIRQVYFCLDDNGVMLLTCRILEANDDNDIDTQTNDVVFLHSIEEFTYSGKYILFLGEEMGFIIKSIFPLQNNMHIFIFVKKPC